MSDQDSKSLEDNLDLVNYIMLHRIYDVLLLMANKIVGSEETQKMSKYHNDGFLLGPAPAYSQKDSEE